MSVGPLLSSHWFKVAQLRPHVHRHVQFHRHVYRGEVWHVVEDRIAGKHHRFNAAAFRFISLLDGKKTLAHVWDILSARLRDDSPTQDEILGLLGQLNAADLLAAGVTPDLSEIVERKRKQQRQRWFSRFSNPMSLRFPLWDPDRFITAVLQATRWIPPGALVFAWLLLVLPSLLLAPQHWPDLTRNFAERMLAFDNLWVMLLAFPLLKGTHELAHGLAVKAHGGEVHETGIMFLVFYPVPYVDASNASAFVQKRQRMLVGASGMLAEIAVASVAFLIWLALEPGFARSLAYNFVVLGSVTTVLFNINPLLRFDGYYMLADAIEVPNLGQRSNQYWQYLATRYVFGVATAKPPPSSPSERRWFLGYAPLAFVYRLSITFGLAWFVAQQYALFGVLMAVWGLVSGLVWPIVKGFKALLTAGHFVERRSRVMSVLFGTSVVTLVVLFVVPVPHHTRMQGVVSLPDRALLHARADGFIVDVDARPSETVKAGEPVMTLMNVELWTQARQQAARLEEVEIKLASAWAVRPAEAERLADEVARERAALQRLQIEMEGLRVRAESHGKLLIEQPRDLPGVFVKKGQTLGYVLGSHNPIVRVVVRQDQVDDVLHDTHAVAVRLPQHFGHEITGVLSRSIPKASRDLPGAALGQTGGGNILLDPHDDKGQLALDSWFEFEIELPAGRDVSVVGSRAFVSFEHKPAPVGVRAWKLVRRLFLARLHV